MWISIIFSLHLQIKPNYPQIFKSVLQIPMSDDSL
jgi:hypothetical protein